MRILVAIKRVIDPYVNIRVKTDESGVETANVKMSLDPFDAIAIEAAIRLREQNIADEIIAISIGVPACQEIIRNALALGADRGILVNHPEPLEPLNIAKCLQAIVAKESPNLVILGKQSIDGDNNQTGQMLAGLLQWSQGTFVSQLTMMDEKVEVVREVDGGLETLVLSLPAVITTDLRLNEPRYATLPNIMKSKQKRIDELTIDELGLDLKPRSQILKVESPKIREAGVILENVQQLVKRLREQDQVI
ncbi:MAG: electron transfer flavoprotein subunit beta/FixA family protein [Gammaproteobacteria bacterium]